MMRTDEARDVRLTDYVEGALPADGAAEIEALLASDPELARDVERARDARTLLAELPARRPPRDFLRKVQRRIRRRSGGRYFHPAVQPFGYRLSVEVFAVIAVAVMAACYFFLDTGRKAATDADLREVPVEAPATPTPPPGE